jgi:hypothetical protein
VALLRGTGIQRKAKPAGIIRQGFEEPLEGASQTGDITGRPKNPRALVGHLRRAQTFLRALGIDITFSREGRTGSRVIRMMRTSFGNTVSSVSIVGAARSNGAQDDQAVLRGSENHLCW